MKKVLSLVALALLTSAILYFFNEAVDGGVMEFEIRRVLGALVVGSLITLVTFNVAGEPVKKGSGQIKSLP